MSEQATQDVSQKTEDQALQEIMGKDEGPVPPPEASGPMAPPEEPESKQPEAEIDLGPDMDTPEPDGEPEKKPEPPKVPEYDKDDMADAIAALRRDNVPKELIDKLRREDPETVLAWAKKAIDRQSGVDKILASSRSGKEAASEGPEEGSTPPSPSTPDLSDEGLSKAAAPFAEMFGEDAAEALVAFGKSIRASQPASAPAESSELGMQVQAMGRIMTDMMIQRTRDGLRERFPQLEDDAVFETVKLRAGRLLKSGDYSLDEAIRDASVLEFGEEKQLDHQKRMVQQHRMRSDGQMTPPERGEEKPAQSREALEDAYLKHLMDGADPVSAARKAGIERVTG